MILYSSDAPAGWNQLPTPIKQKFYDIAGKGDWTAHEAYDHLVPDGLKDNPQEVATWMDGGEVTVDVWNQQTKTYDEVTYEVPDRDVSRIEAGGDYSADNTIMEDMSVNRSRGAADMTDAEYDVAVETNAVDENIIETAFDENVEAIADAVPDYTFGEVLSDAVLPLAGAYKAAAYVSSKFEDPKDKWGWGSIAAGAGALIMASTLGTPIAIGYGGYKLTKLGIRVYNKYQPA